MSEHGGKRESAGRKKGPDKERAWCSVLPATMNAWRREAYAKNKTLGEVIDDIMKKA
jgi:hypothetical protein